MGEYIKHPRTGREIKIATLDHAFYSRAQLIYWQRHGFKGYYARQFDDEAGREDTLKRLLNDPRTLYPLPRACLFDQKVHTVIVKNNGFKHSEVILQKKGNRGSAYTYLGLPCKQAHTPLAYAVMIGERYDEKGQARTIFKCDCCEAFFSLDAVETQKLREKHPYWAEWIKENRSA